jgi:hypothetical protein
MLFVVRLNGGWEDFMQAFLVFENNNLMISKEQNIYGSLCIIWFEAWLELYFTFS